MPVLTSRQVAEDTWTTEDKQITGLSSVDTSKSILFVSGIKIGDVGNRPGHCLVRCRLSSDTTIDYDRNDANGSVSVIVGRQLMEFSSGMSVQRGSSTMSSTTVNETISEVDRDKSFVIITNKSAGSSFSDDDFAEADLSTDTNLRLRVTGSSASHIVDWQVCTMTDGTGDVQRGSTSLSGTSATATLTDVDRSKTFLVFSYRASDGVFPEDGAVRGRINANNQITFDRVTSGGTTMTISWFTVEMTDGTVVAEYLHTMPANTDENDDTITAVTTSKTTLIVPTQRWGKNDNDTTDEFATASPLLELTTTTNVNFSRDSSFNADHDHSYYVVEWNDTEIPVGGNNPLLKTTTLGNVLLRKSNL